MAQSAMIRPAQANDAAAVAAIYNHYILHTVVTFEEEALPGEEMARRITEVRGDGFPWLVYEEEGRVVGYAYASRWKSRCAYRFAVEATVYLEPGATGRGMGRRLYSGVIEAASAMGMHVVIGGIALPNEASVGLHEKLGFKKVAHFQEVGRKFDQWIDVGYWELRLPARRPYVARVS